MMADLTLPDPSREAFGGEADRPTFGREFRMRHRASFAAMQRWGWRHHAGPLLMLLRSRSDGPMRLGLAVPRRVGHAPRRNLIKRRLREAFRLRRASFSSGIDLLVIVRPHEPLEVEAYGILLERGVRAFTRREGIT